jgi:hypothetical protein
MRSRLRPPDSGLDHVDRPHSEFGEFAIADKYAVQNSDAYRPASSHTAVRASEIYVFPPPMP